MRSPVDHARMLATDSFYVSVGFSVLVFQRMQVQRRDIEKAVARQRDETRSQVEALLGRRSES